MPDENDHRTETTPSPESPEPAGGGAPSLTPEATAASTDHDDSATEAGQPSTGVAPRLITAVEIENFKGIGRPMRIDLRPVTLLFGNNSAGKSTVLHALCYAHEVLSHRDVDAHKTQLGGDRIDLGGFRNFVHAHDPTRTVRLRFELNLTDWETPTGLFEKLESEYEHTDFEVTEIEALVTSGWVELQAELRGERPLLTSYEVGVNKTLAGRICTRQQGGTGLEFNPAHPLLIGGHTGGISSGREHRVETAQVHATADRVREVPGPKADDWQLSYAHLYGLTSALPYWGEPLLPTGRGEVTVEFNSRVSILLAGIGQTLRDELARLRYIGPVRGLHPRTRVSLPPPDPKPWVDGSAAWTHLLTSPHREIHEVSDWLAQENRLDTGYALRTRSTWTISEDTIRLVAKMESGNLPSGELEKLAAEILSRPSQREIELVTTKNELPVRVADVGVGISQVFPVVVAALDPRHRGITAIEQPELHLHPRVQVELGELFAQQIGKGGIFLLETHSEHLLLRFMKRMRQTSDGTLPDGAPEVRPEDIAVYFVERDPDGGQTLIREMPLNERGELVEAWPGGFFEEDLREIF